MPKTKLYNSNKNLIEVNYFHKQIMTFYNFINKFNVIYDNLQKIDKKMVLPDTEFQEEKKQNSKEKVVSLPLNYFDYKTKTLQENSFQTCSVKQKEPLSMFLKEKFDRSVYRFSLIFEGYFSA